MPGKRTRIVIDTNLWISFLISKDLEKLDSIIFNRKATLIFSKELLAEFLEVANRRKFRRFFSLNDMEELLAAIDEFSEIIEVKSEVQACRDEKDNFLLSLSVDGKADFLLTGDKDLLVLGKIGKTEIKTISDFLQNH